MSNKLLEYVHLGVPVLAARLPSYATYLSTEATWYWQPGDAESLAATISDFAKTGSETRRARAICAQRNLESIGWPQERARLIATYRSLLEG
jgi:glycosyltransferase involved in cell wall biosynthesis